MDDKPKSGRGFAGMTLEARRKIASMGGRAAHASGNAHQFDSAEASAAGKKRHENAQRRRADQAAADGSGT